jgi:hypothetical protein
MIIQLIIQPLSESINAPQLLDTRATGVRWCFALNRERCGASSARVNRIVIHPPAQLHAGRTDTERINTPTQAGPALCAQRGMLILASPPPSPPLSGSPLHPSPLAVF